ncbi:MAG: CBS domain-containing protein [Deltaproteobacteria bacterium]|nr:MAG: CBS domain-containing protein [Deltaproteobacteria bacterium]
MFVNRSMTKKVITIGPDTDIFSARDLMEKHHIRHLPVVREDGCLVGMITDRDLRSVIPYEFSSISGKDHRKTSEQEGLARKIEEVMTTHLIKISPLDTIQDALLLIQRSKVGALPVVDDQNKLQGIISVRDLLRAFINVLGIGEPGTLLCILVEEKVGQLKKIVDAVTEDGISLGSVLVARYWDEKKRAVFCYLLTLNVRDIKKKLVDLGFDLLDPMQWYMDQLPEPD